ncbi:hypothetical protein [Kosakonia cowanii]|uniref:hypothetical protein n=1 Tax=Kosakonia cowanii TaxID=208223 RepID=UPI003EEE2C00
MCNVNEEIRTMARLLTQEMTRNMLPAIMDALQVEQKTYSVPLKPCYRDLIHSPEGVAGLAEQSLLLNLLR